MIILNLTCSANHQFEAWFKSEPSFLKQIASKLVCCPQCGVDEVKKLSNTDNKTDQSSFNLKSSTVVSRQEIKMISEQFDAAIPSVSGKAFSFDDNKTIYKADSLESILNIASEVLDKGDVTLLNEDDSSLLNFFSKPPAKDKLN